MTIFLAPVLLIFAHYIADFAMQTAFMADMKGRVHTDSHGWHALVAHSMHHAGLAFLVSWWVGGSVAVAFAVMAVTGVSHGVIDYFKAVHDSFSVHVDQAMHLSIALLLGLVLAILS